MKVFDSLAYIYLIVNLGFFGKFSFNVLFLCYLSEDKKFLLDKEFLLKNSFNIILQLL